MYALMVCRARHEHMRVPNIYQRIITEIFAYARFKPRNFKEVWELRKESSRNLIGLVGVFQMEKIKEKTVQIIITIDCLV